MRFFIYLLVLLVPQAYAGQFYTTGEKPEWVEQVEVLSAEELPHDEIQNGVHYLLADSQLRVPAEGPPSYFSRYVTLITNQSGLDQESQINISFDPSYEQVELHRVTARRNGEYIDLLSTSRIRELDQEDELDSQIYNGLKTINILVEDIRVGDLLDYSFTVKGANPVFDGTFSAAYDLQWSVPVSAVNRRILWEKQSKLHSKVENSALVVKEFPTDAGVEYRIAATDVQALYEDEDTPAWKSPYAAVYFSESDDWRSVVEWGMGLFEPVIRASQPVAAVVDKLSSVGMSESDRIVGALQFVQSEIRYVGIEIGENSHQAVPPEQTLRRRYGDCKDKAVLLISILREMGISASPALVNTTLKKTIAERLPSKRLFDHAIVAVEFNGEVFWLDPTRQYQYGALEEIYQPRYEYALVLDSESDNLMPMESGEIESAVKILDRYTFSEDGFEEVLYTTHTEYLGWNAERQRRNLEVDGVQQLKRAYLEFYQGYYPDIENLEGPEFENDLKKPRLKVREKYSIRNFWGDSDEDGRYTAWVYSNAINSYLEEPDQISRSMDYRLRHPVYIQQEILLDLAGEWDLENDEFSEINEFFEFTSRAAYDESANQLRLIYSYKSKTNTVPLAGFDRYLQRLEIAREMTDYGLYNYDEQNETVEEAEEADWILIALAICVGLFLLAIVLWILDRRRKDAIAYNSRWKLHHFLLIVSVMPLGLLGVGIETGLLPSEAVVSGDQLMQRDIKFMQRKGILNAGDKLLYFYSDAFFSNREDGNGLSDRHVFSYWVDEQDDFRQELAEFDEIDDIKVFWAEEWSENTILEVYRRGKSKMIVYLSASDGMDRVFVDNLKNRWRKKGGERGEKKV